MYNNTNKIEEIKLLLKYYSFDIDDWQDNDWLLEVLKLFLDKEREVELNCWNDEIDAINLAIDLGFRVIEIKQFLIRLSGTTDMLNLNKIMSLKNFFILQEKTKKKICCRFSPYLLRTKYSLDTMPEKIMFYKKEKFDLTVDILNRHNVEFH